MDNDMGASVPEQALVNQAATHLGRSGFDPSRDLPAGVLAQLSALPEIAPEDFECAICLRSASNRWKYSPRDYERPPICNSCENIKGYYWNGARHRAKPTGGSFRDRREALRISAIADAIADEASRQQWSAKHGRP